ncbi:S locus-related glycoprotein 1 binding pollen coat protein [Arabidopsis suecica]|uniref:S locus-related glycoprotein 1 binding pollen coat protein n=1 Tax=Arabidopsis suecica TaxID=45249 RepID=A0A8T1ZWD5_ARASU|nr:S locus-related glycoprotein 1 binding pollen coat protein [Arabidopsis suecica]
MVFFVIGMVMEKTQGHICHSYIEAEHCEVAQCNQMCAAKWKGTGTCEPPTGTPLTQTCYCAFNCET